jgi:hypothetical protein
LEYLPEHLGLRVVNRLRAGARYHPDLVPDLYPARPFTFIYIVTDNTRAVHFRWLRIPVFLLLRHGLAVSRETLSIYRRRVPRLLIWDGIWLFPVNSFRRDTRGSRAGGAGG